MSGGPIDGDGKSGRVGDGGCKVVLTMLTTTNNMDIDTTPIPICRLGKLAIATAQRTRAAGSIPTGMRVIARGRVGSHGIRGTTRTITLTANMRMSAAIRNDIGLHKCGSGGVLILISKRRVGAT